MAQDGAGHQAGVASELVKLQLELEGLRPRLASAESTPHHSGLPVRFGAEILGAITMPQKSLKLLSLFLERNDSSVGFSFSKLFADDLRAAAAAAGRTSE